MIIVSTGKFPFALCLRHAFVSALCFWEPFAAVLLRKGRKSLEAKFPSLVSTGMYGCYGCTDLCFLVKMLALPPPAHTVPCVCSRLAWSTAAILQLWVAKGTPARYLPENPFGWLFWTEIRGFSFWLALNSVKRYLRLFVKKKNLHVLTWDRILAPSAIVYMQPLIKYLVV